MGVDRFLRSAFLGLALLHVAGLQTQSAAPAWTGSVALVTLLLTALLPSTAPLLSPSGAVSGGDGGPRRAARLGLAALAAAALLLDARHGGQGWPTALATSADPGDWGPVEAALLAVAGGGLAVAAVGAVGLPRSRCRRLLPVAGAVLLGVLGPALVVPWDHGRATDPVYRAAAVAPLLAAAALLGVAAGTMVAARRGAAAAGLAVLGCLLTVPLTGVLTDLRLLRLVERYGYWTFGPVPLDQPGLLYSVEGDLPMGPGPAWLTVCFVLALLIALPWFVAVEDDPELPF